MARVIEYPKAVLTDGYAKKIVWGAGQIFFDCAIFRPDPPRMAKYWTYIIAGELDKYGRLRYRCASICEMQPTVSKEFYLDAVNVYFGDDTCTLEELLEKIRRRALY
jgi:hypothetical protein